jgi:molybdenum cofactor biosynthesis enzyme MoaA
MFEVDLFGTKIQFRSEYCSKNGKVPEKIDKPYTNIYVQMTKNCNAKCQFCPWRQPHQVFDFKKYQKILATINKKVDINKVSFTGGEPTLYWKEFLEALIFTKECNYDIFTVINTNGYQFTKLKKYSQYLNSIALSRHHYDDRINQQILGYNAPDSRMLANFKEKGILHLSCNLIKGYVDSEIEVKKYLDHASQLGIYDVGFVSLMKVNNYCKEHHIDFNSLKFEEDKNIFISKDWNNKNLCRCRNYLYASEAKGEIVKLYSRYYVDTNCRESQLVYDGQYLRDGFGGNIII